MKIKYDCTQSFTYRVLCYIEHISFGIHNYNESEWAADEFLQRYWNATMSNPAAVVFPSVVLGMALLRVAW
jgi:hypothetical protein